jgi:hypothetical protein
MRNKLICLLLLFLNMTVFAEIIQCPETIECGINGHERCYWQQKIDENWSVSSPIYNQHFALSGKYIFRSASTQINPDNGSYAPSTTVCTYIYADFPQVQLSIYSKPGFYSMNDDKGAWQYTPSENRADCINQDSSLCKIINQ